MSIIKNAILYRVELPAINKLSSHLEEREYSELSETQTSKTTFIKNPATLELVTPIVNGFSFTAKREEKIIPRASVVAEAKKRAEVIEHAEERKLFKSEMNAIEEDVFFEFTKVALVKSTIVNCFYNEKLKVLIVASASKNMANIVTSVLIQCVGSITSQTINISNAKLGITAKTKDFLNSDFDASVFAGFSVGDQIKISHHSEAKEVVNFNGVRIEDICEEILKYFHCGFHVDFIKLESGGMSFKLDSNFLFKSIHYFTNEQEDEVNDERIYSTIWKDTASAEMFLICSAAKSLTELLEYKKEDQLDIFNNQNEEGA